MQKSVNKQSGAALILFALVLVLGATAFLISQLDGTGVKIERDKNNALILAKAKTALIGYAIGVIGSGQRPGDLIRPDSLSTSETPANYDGTADSGCLDASKPNGLPLINSSNVNWRCLGRLPWKDLGMSINAPSENDPNGVMPWYAVSANLVDPTCLAVLNSNTLNLTFNPGPLDCSGATLPYPWLTVHDGSGNAVSNRVAAVIFIPGAARGAQARPNSPSLAAANQYLDTLVVPAGCAAPCVPGSYNNAGMNNDFIFASENIPLAATNNFNDQLVYITIDELMAATEKRAAQEATSQLRSYYLASSGTPANRFYPYAANLGDNNNACVNSKLTGLLPIMPAQALCTTATSCTASFPMTVVNFSLAAGSYTSKSGACNRAGNICTCSGFGSCVKSGGAGSTFACSANGNCSSAGISPNGSFNFTYSPKIPDVTTTTVSCSIAGAGNVACSGAGSFSSPPTNCPHPNPGLAKFPKWFTDNHWQDLMYYTISNDCNFLTPGCAVGSLTVGTKNNKYALVISSGKKIPTPFRPATVPLPDGQSRPSSSIVDYLDSAENTNGDSIYDAVGTPRTSNYNDQMFIVAP